MFWVSIFLIIFCMICWSVIILYLNRIPLDCILRGHFWMYVLNKMAILLLDFIDHFIKFWPILNLEVLSRIFLLNVLTCLEVNCSALFAFSLTSVTTMPWRSWNKTCAWKKLLWVLLRRSGCWLGSGYLPRLGVSHLSLFLYFWPSFSWWSLPLAARWPFSYSSNFFCLPTSCKLFVMGYPEFLGWLKILLILSIRSLISLNVTVEWEM